MSVSLALRGITKRFGATVALEDARCIVRAGTVHALLGENGAGKTTLMRVAFGLVAPDAGTIELAGAARRFRSSHDAIMAGIGMVHQHFMLIPAMTVAENVALGGRGRFDADMAASLVARVGSETGLTLDPGAAVRTLDVSAQQRLEIVKALAHDATLLILDEPTAVLTPSESVELHGWIRRFAARGGSVVLITHKLREALAVADDVTVLRRGHTVLESATRATSEEAVIAALVGERDVSGSAAPILTAVAADRELRTAPVAIGERILSLDGAGFTDARGVQRLRDATLQVRSGEVLGVLGVEGAGQHELLRILAGRLQPTTGRVERPPSVGFIPADRLHDALIPALSVVENVALAEAGEARGLMRWRGYRQRTAEIAGALEVRMPGLDAPVSALSGGNQQKLVVGRERARAADAIVAENPTRGLDIRATAQVRAELLAQARGGAAVVYHSSDLDEVLSLATRVVVCHAGRVREVALPDDPSDVTPFARAMVGADA